MVSEELKARFNAKWKADPATGCWMWTAAKHPAGYGQIKLPKQRKQIPAHRLSYLIHRGEIPRGHQVCHRCDTPGCVNPEHLFIGTSKDNHDDMVAKDRHTRGERSAVKLNDQLVGQILTMLDGGHSQTTIAKAVGVSQITVSRIKRGLRWRHLVTDPKPAEPRAKPLTSHQIKQVKAMLAAGVEGTAIATAFKVSPVTISRIKLGHRHADV